MASRRPRVSRACRSASRSTLPPRAPGSRNANDVRREEQFLAWLAELVHLTEIEGRATARLWFDRLRKPDGLPRSSSDRQWERMKVALVEHGVPHEIGEVPASDEIEAVGACTIAVRVGKVELEKYRARRKRCRSHACKDPAGPWLPPRAPFFHRNPERADGLSLRCAACERGSRVERYHRGRVEGRDPDLEAARRASARVTMAARRARLRRECEVMSSPDSRGIPGAHDSANVNDHTGGAA